MPNALKKRYNQLIKIVKDFAKLEEVEDLIDILLKFVNKEELMFMNKIYYYCMKVSNNDFQFEDFQRNLQILKVNKKIKLF